MTVLFARSCCSFALKEEACMLQLQNDSSVIAVPVFAKWIYDQLLEQGCVVKVGGLFRCLQRNRIKTYEHTGWQGIKGSLAVGSC